MMRPMMTSADTNTVQPFDLSDAKVTIHFNPVGFTIEAEYAGKTMRQEHGYRFPIADMQEALVKIYERVQTLNAQN